MTAAHGGQILLSQTTRELVAQSLPEGVQLRDLGEHRLAARLWGSAQRLRAVLGATQPPVYHASYACALAAVRYDLGEQVFATAWAQGQAMTPEQALSAQQVVSSVM